MICPRCNIPLTLTKNPGNDIYFCTQPNCKRFQFYGTDPLRAVIIKLNGYEIIININMDVMLIISEDKKLYIRIPKIQMNLIDKNDEQLTSWMKAMMVFQ